MLYGTSGTSMYQKTIYLVHVQGDMGREVVTNLRCLSRRTELFGTVFFRGLGLFVQGHGIVKGTLCPGHQTIFVIDMKKL